jgi:dTDP-4-dehydrorhamnose 3,5-epimerase
MLFSDCSLAGVRIIDPEPRADARGRFMRAWCSREFAKAGIEFVPVQANMGLSKRRGTIRGLHYQAEPALEAKLVRCTAGAIFDVAVDMRPESPTFLRWHGETLTAENGRMLFVPEGCAHGCLSLEDATEIYYLTSAIYTPEAVRGVKYDDPAVGIRWPAEITEVSEQDAKWPAIDMRGTRK